MGNCHGGIRVLKDGECSHHFKLGQSASMSIKEGQKKREDDGKESQTWEVSYNVEQSTCTVSMTKTTGRDSKDESLEIIIKDLNQEKINDDVMKEYTECLKHKIGNGGREYAFASTSHIACTLYCWDSPGLVEKSTLCNFGSGTRKGLYYSEWNEEKKEKPRMVTVAHFYAHSNSRERLPKNTIDIGFSIVVKIRVLDNGNLDFKIDGPIQHPSSDLFYMFEKVKRTRSWTSTSCPHCAEIQIQKQRRWMSPCQSDSEDGDGYLPAASGRHGNSQQQMARNNGQFAGDGYGSIYERNMMIFLKKFKFLM